MLEGGVIEEVESSKCVSPIVLVCKADKSLSLCIDLRALNANIVVDCHHLPNINEVVSMLGVLQFFSH